MELSQTKLNKIKLLNELIWENKVKDANIRSWLEGISRSRNLSSDCKESLLCALGNFIYFPDGLIREMLRSLFRDIYKKKIIEDIRKNDSGCFDKKIIASKICNTLEKTKFLGVGNPSESGPHLLYLFRQENKLHTENFISMDQAFHYEMLNGNGQVRLRDLNIEHYIFIDDFCGSGLQASNRLRDYIATLKYLKPDCFCCYYCLVGMLDGLNVVKSQTSLDAVEAVIGLDASFKIFSNESKILVDEEDVDRKTTLKAICDDFAQHFGIASPYGFSNGEQLIGFHHNTPDNTVPLFWWNDWRYLSPVFKRHQKM